MKKTYWVLMFSLFKLFCFGQNETDSVKQKSNPIIYSSVLIGNTFGSEVKGLTFSVDLNYQINKDLFTFRGLHISEINKETPFFSAILVVPLFIGGDSMNEYALLYGKRYIFNGSALSVSAGISNNLIRYKDETRTKFKDYYVGIPFEINFNIFKARKKRFRIIYGLVPVGKPTAFGRSVSFKLYGNIGRFNYFGAGISFGFGWHKKY